MLYALLAVHVPAPPVSEIVPFVVVPSPHVTVHVCVSDVPASVNDARAVTVAPVKTELPAAGAVIVATGATLETLTVKLPLLEAPLESVTVTFTVYGVARSLTYLCDADRPPGDAANVEAALPSPQSTVTVQPPLPPEKEPRLKVAVAPSLELWVAPALSTIAGRFTVTVCVEVVVLPDASVAV